MASPRAAAPARRKGRRGRGDPGFNLGDSIGSSKQRMSYFGRQLGRHNVAQDCDGLIVGTSPARGFSFEHCAARLFA